MNLFETRSREEESTRIPTPKGVDPIGDLPSYRNVASDLTGGKAPTDEQKRVCGVVEQGEGNVLVEAVAGAGKTATLLMAARLTGQKRCIICAYNQSIKEELEETVDSEVAQVKTLHAIGRSLFFQKRSDASVQKGKMFGIAADLASDFENNVRDHKWAIVDLCERVKQTCTDPSIHDAVRKMALRYGLDWIPKYAEKVEKGIRRSMEEARQDGTIDMEDMIYVPVQLGLAQGRYDWVLVDEAQDLNEAQRRLTRQICGDDGRVLYIGDRDQAINGFQGADPKSMDRIEEETNPTTLSLDVSFRCPRDHARKAREFVPRIRSAPGADDGTIEYRSLERIPSTVEAGDLVMARTNKIVLNWCFETAIWSATPAWFSTRKFGEDGGLAEYLKKMIEKAASNISGRESLLDGIREIEEEANDDLERQCAEGLQGLLEAEGSMGKTPFKKLVDRYFNQSDRENAAIFSTIHRAKGKEASRVGIIRPDLSLAQTGDPDWEQRQEQNLKYVAYTRSTDKLFLFTEEGFKRDVTYEQEEKSYMPLRKENIREGERIEHRDYGAGTVIDVMTNASKGHIAVHFDNVGAALEGGSAEAKDYGFREVPVDKPVFMKL